MSIATTCPKCEAVFRLSDSLAGKRVQCQKCLTRFLVPRAGIAETQPGIPVDAVSAAPKAARTKPVAPPEPEEPEELEVEEIDAVPARRKRRDTSDEDEDDDRPRRKRRDDDDADRDDDDEDDRPRRRRKVKSRRSGQGSKTPMILVGVGLAAVLLFGCVGLGALMWIIGGASRGPTPVVFAADNTFRSDNALRVWNSRKDDKHFHAYTLKMEARRTYDIEMRSNNLDSFLFLIDGANRIVRADDDGGGGLNARIVHTPQQAGDFRIEATSFLTDETGSFTLIVRRR